MDLLLANLIAILKVVFAFGLVVFVHELGHFLAARWCGVKVERFSIGFGPAIVAWTSRKSGTEYRIAWFPFGGYVKMHGQDDVKPEEMTSETLRQDPTSYPGRPVWQRMIIISAGVAMNIVLGLVCFAIMYNIGPQYTPPVIGALKPGGPAWRAGLRAGDEVLAIDGQELMKFKDLQIVVQLSDPDEGPLRVRYRRGDQVRTALVLPEKQALWPQVGVLGPTAPVLARNWPIAPETAAGAAGLKPGDRILAVNGEPVSSGEELRYRLAQQPDQPVTLEVERAGEADRTSSRVEAQVIRTELPPEPMRTLPVRFEMGPIVAITADRKDSLPLREGDVLVAINGSPIDPFRLPDQIRQLAGSSVEIELLRPQPDGTPSRMTVTVVPTDEPTWLNEPILVDSPIDCPGLGIAYQVSPVIASVDNPDAAGELQPGDRIIALLPVVPEDAELFGSAEWVEVTEESSPLAWAFWFLQQVPGATLRVRAERGAQQFEVDLNPEPADDWFAPARNLVLEPLEKRLPPLGLLGSIARGWQDTVTMVKVIYVGLERMLIRGTISVKSMRGPITIARVFYYQAKRSWTEYLFTIALFSINLAVLNFLPIPVLDGGHMVFLLWELIFRRPPSRRVQIGLSYVGLALLLTLMLWVTLQDITDLF